MCRVGQGGASFPRSLITLERYFYSVCYRVASQGDVMDRTQQGNGHCILARRKIAKSHPRKRTVSVSPLNMRPCSQQGKNKTAYKKATVNGVANHIRNNPWLFRSSLDRGGRVQNIFLVPLQSHFGSNVFRQASPPQSQSPSRSDPEYPKQKQISMA
ncbi:hypothetical protein ACLOJK_013405 [Asimina triloba]